MGTQTHVLTQEILGLNPYIVVEVEPDGEGDEGPGYTLGIRAGGGIAKQETIVAFLLHAAAELTGVETGEFLVIVDAYRAAAGLRPLTDVAFEMED